VPIKPSTADPNYVIERHLQMECKVAARKGSPSGGDAAGGEGGGDDVEPQASGATRTAAEAEGEDEHQNVDQEESKLQTKTTGSQPITTSSSSTTSPSRKPQAKQAGPLRRVGGIPLPSERGGGESQEGQGIDEGKMDESVHSTASDEMD